jgi:hypothetical protein
VKKGRSLRLLRGRVISLSAFTKFHCAPSHTRSLRHVTQLFFAYLEIFKFFWLLSAS